MNNNLEGKKTIVLEEKQGREESEANLSPRELIFPRIIFQLPHSAVGSLLWNLNADIVQLFII